MSRKRSLQSTSFSKVKAKLGCKEFIAERKLSQRDFSLKLENKEVAR